MPSNTRAWLLCCYSDENTVWYNLQNHYDLFDQIVVVYGPFGCYPVIREKVGLPIEDLTLSLVKQFIQQHDTEHKITLVEGTFADFTESRNAGLCKIDTDFFESRDCDEFYLDKNKSRIKSFFNTTDLTGVNCVYVGRRNFAIDFGYTVARNRHKATTVKCGRTTFSLPGEGVEHFIPIAYRTSIGEFIKNQIDSFFVFKGTNQGIAFDLSRCTYLPDVVYNHYPFMAPPLERLARSLYYSTIYNGVKPEDIVVETDKKTRHPIARLGYEEVHYLKYSGEHPLVLSKQIRYIKDMEEFDNADTEEKVKEVIGRFQHANN